MRSRVIDPVLSAGLEKALAQTKLAGAPDFAGLLGKVVELTAWENELGNGGG